MQKELMRGFLKPYQGVIAAETGHIAVHETGAIEEWYIFPIQLKMVRFTANKS